MRSIFAVWSKACQFQWHDEIWPNQSYASKDIFFVSSITTLKSKAFEAMVYTQCMEIYPILELTCDLNKSSILNEIHVTDLSCPLTVMIVHKSLNLKRSIIRKKGCMDPVCVSHNITSYSDHFPFIFNKSRFINAEGTRTISGVTNGYQNIFLLHFNTWTFQSVSLFIFMPFSVQKPSLCSHKAHVELICKGIWCLFTLKNFTPLCFIFLHRNFFSEANWKTR